MTWSYYHVKLDTSERTAASTGLITVDDIQTGHLHSVDFLLPPVCRVFFAVGFSRLGVYFLNRGRAYWATCSDSKRDVLKFLQQLKLVIWDALELYKLLEKFMSAYSQLVVVITSKVRLWTWSPSYSNRKLWVVLDRVLRVGQVHLRIFRETRRGVAGQNCPEWPNLSD